ncbi:spore germination protein GerPC [Paenibacillus rigui]|uniref:Uncharacterized protein n=1 Tax=Paenibacillus rigui TaxID=554312 RepID=A0A229UMP4_9BACL|nr:spore germination protein GerPC [Paenibacillus rigui]OXM84757.1 hypothetical protein CF651_19835 [Paenibacillus rigui]
MYTWQQWCQYVQSMHAYVQAKDGKIQQLEKAIEDLKAEIGNLKDQKRIHIDKIEYKFDQLKVETLEGTLNIGINPSAVEDMAVNSKGDSSTTNTNVEAQAMDQKAQPQSPLDASVQGLRGEITKELLLFLNQQVPRQLAVLQAEHGHTLDSWHQRLIVEDLGRQIDQRITYYLRQMEPGATEDQLSSIKDSVIFRTKNDIQAALNEYFNKLPQKDVELT